MLEAIPSTGQIVIYWMAFEPETSKQQWLIAVGQLHGRRAVLEFIRPEGGTFVGNQPANMNHWGDAELIFQSCTHATLEFFSEVAGVEGLIDCCDSRRLPLARTESKFPSQPEEWLNMRIKGFLFLTLALWAADTVGQDFDIYVSDAGNFNNPPWQILKFDQNGEHPEVFIQQNLAWPQDILFSRSQQYSAGIQFEYQPNQSLRRGDRRVHRRICDRYWRAHPDENRPRPIAVCLAGIWQPEGQALHARW